MRMLLALLLASPLAFAGEQVDREVEAMVAEIVHGKNIEAHTKRFKALRAAAVPALLGFLVKPESYYRLTALYAMQFAWAPEAQEPVLRALEDKDTDVRKLAYLVLARNVPEQKLAERLRFYADGENLGPASLVFEWVDKHYPDESLKRIRRLLRHPLYRASAVPRLSHYLSPALTEDTLPLLDAPDSGIRRAGVVGLISQLSGADAVRLKVRALLSDANADLREVAAEYFTWLGQPNDLPSLLSVLEREKDRYVSASCSAAVRAIKERSEVWAKSPERSTDLATIQHAHALEPLFVYRVGEHDRKQEFADRALRLQETLVAPGCVQRENPFFLGDATIPTAKVWIPPIRDYYDPSRKSFGITVDKDSTAFAGSVHVGDDAGWNREMRTVVAVAPGMVRSVQHIFSWGFIVVIEHRLGDGEGCCSLYAHLSPMLHVKPGDTVEAGRKIGSIGRSHTVENGGYAAHVHFGLRHGAYENGDWVCGYISTKAWSEGGIGWLDPQAFFKAHSGASSATSTAPMTSGR